MKYKTVIFDLDGTLLDTLDDITDSVNFVMEKYGFPLRSKEEIRNYVGNGVSSLIALCIPDGINNALFGEIMAFYVEHYHINCLNKTKPYPHIIEVLKDLNNMGVRLCVVSNKPDDSVKRLCKLFFGEYISIALGEKTGILRKPAPDLIYIVLDSLNADKEETLYVGDTEVDVLTSKNAGISCIAVTWGFRDEEMLKSAGAEIIINDPCELLAVSNVV